MGSGGTGSPAASATTAPMTTATPKPKPKPTGAPAITMVECQTLMTLAEANQIISPPSPATTLQAVSSDTVGVCNYLTASKVLVLKILTETYTGPVPIPQTTLEGMLAQLVQSPNLTINSATTVSGVGDQAVYLAVSFAGTGSSVDAHVFYTIYGKVIVGCVTYRLNGVGQSGTQGQLQQCAEQVISRL